MTSSIRELYPDSLPYFDLAADEVVLEIALRTLQGLSFDDSKAMFRRGQLYSHRFYALFRDSQVVAALLRKAHSLSVLVKAKFPLSLVSQVSPREQPLVKETFERMVNELVSLEKSLSAVIELLRRLKPEERELITCLSLEDLAPPSFAFDLATGTSHLDNQGWNEQLLEFFRLLPHISQLRIPAQLTTPSFFFEALAQTHVKTIEIRTRQIPTSFIPKLPSLRKLFFFSCNELTTEMLEEILNNCSQIEGLSLTDTPLVQLERLSTRHAFRCLTLRGKNFGKEALNYLLKRFPLKGLTLGQVSLQEPDIYTLLKSDLTLEELSLAHLPVQDVHFDKVSASLCRSLRVLKLYGCRHVTSEGVEAILRIFPLLTHLDLRFTGATSFIENERIEILI